MFLFDNRDSSVSTKGFIFVRINLSVADIKAAEKKNKKYPGYSPCHKAETA